MIKILQIGMCERGGVESFIFNHYKVIDRDNYSFDFIRMVEHIAYEEQIQSLGGTIFSVANSRKNPMLCYKQIQSIIDENHYDVVHIHISHFADIIPLLATKLSHCSSIILHAHNNGMNGRLSVKLHTFHRIVTSKMKVERLACSKSAGEFMFGNSPFTIFENAIPKETFFYDEEKRMQMRNLLEIPEHAYVIGTVGRLDTQKNQSFLIETFKEYLNINPFAYLMIVGDGVLKSFLQALAHKLDIESKVIFTGFKEDVSPYYQAMDVFCLPSIFEGLGIVGIEAQMSGLPCIFSDKCAEEVNVSGKSVFLSLHEKDRWLHMIQMHYLSRNYNERTIPIDGYDIKENIKKLEKLYTKRN